MRYIILVLLNLPIITMALINIVTQYKIGRLTKSRLNKQLFSWCALLIVLVGSFPLYNYLSNRPPLDAHELSVFDMIQTTAIILLIYIVNYLRQKIERSENMIRSMHQSLAIKLSARESSEQNQQ